ncbi:hypothetical protein AC578_10617 [Pseudocercospora eumusae]|uniref:Hydrophobin n=1 Tax=Pseudocercospora eumusae TaxID=321146 RepID=A0A139HKD5_9PEZI|nr:hypothetical protein AC578_10617 [Pseudocercospora eumusae]
MHLVEAGTLVLGISLFSSLASADPYAYAYPPSTPVITPDTPRKYCACLRPGDGRQDPEPTKKVCPEFSQNGAYYTELDFSGPGGGYIGACAKVGYGVIETFAAKCIAIYGAKGHDGEAGAQCCESDAEHKNYSCQDYPPDPTKI